MGFTPIAFRPYRQQLNVMLIMSYLMEVNKNSLLITTFLFWNILTFLYCNLQIKEVKKLKS